VTALATAARVSEINQGLYRTLLGPAVCATANETSANHGKLAEKPIIRIRSLFLFGFNTPLLCGG
jgi:hypothetical protein